MRGTIKKSDVLIAEGVNLTLRAPLPQLPDNDFAPCFGIITLPGNVALDLDGRYTIVLEDGRRVTFFVAKLSRNTAHFVGWVEQS